MSLLVVGSVAFDSIDTPEGTADEVLGGSASYFGYVASFFVPVRLVGVVGDDFPGVFREALSSRPIDLAGLETRADGSTFRWRGRYSGSMNEAETLRVDLNVLEDHQPRIPEKFLDSEYVFLANTTPHTQRHVLSQMTSPRFSVCDTMNLWIETERSELVALFREVDCVVLNDGEARLLTEFDNLIRAARRIQEMGPRHVVIKKGDHGAILASGQTISALPAFPMERVVDPTGAGDSFAGGMMGFLAESEGQIGPESLRGAVARGIVVASFTIEDFSLRRLMRTSRDEIEGRLARYRAMLAF